MRALRMSLVLAAAIAALQACAHPPTPAPAAAVAAGALRAASEATLEQAEKLVRDTFAAEGGNVSQVELYKTDKAGVYSYACYFARPERGQLCLYTARGQVDANAGELTARRRLDTCLGRRPQRPQHRLN